MSGYDACSCYSENPEIYHTRCYGHKCFLAGWYQHSEAVKQIQDKILKEILGNNNNNLSIFCLRANQIQIGSSCYQYFNTPATISEAKNICSKHKVTYGDENKRTGKLAKINTRDKFFILGHMRDDKSPDDKNSPFFMGELNEQDVEDVKMYVIGRDRNQGNQGNNVLAYVSRMEDVPSVYAVDGEIEMTFFCEFPAFRE